MNKYMARGQWQRKKDAEETERLFQAEGTAQAKAQQ